MAKIFGPVPPVVINNIELSSTADGASGCDVLGMTPISGMTATTPQGAFEELQANLGASGGNTLITLPVMQTYAGSTVDTATDSIKLSATTDDAVDLQFFTVPDIWDGTSDFAVNIFASTAVGEASPMRFHVDYLVIKDGAVAWSDTGYTSTTAVDITLTNQTIIQKISDTTLYIPAANFEVGASVYFRLYREGSHANDTHTQDLLVNTVYLSFTQATSSGSTATDGFASGGTTGVVSNIIDTFTFASAANATSWGNLTVARRYVSGQSSTSDGFTSGGDTGLNSSVIDAFTFASPANATAWGNLTVARHGTAGQSSSTDGFASGGYTTASLSVIDAFTFASAANATAWGNLTVARGYAAGQSSITDGFTSGGYVTSAVIDTFAFSTTGNATAWGNLTLGRRAQPGQSSATDGFTSGGYDGLSYSSVIDAFTFASAANATAWGNLTVARYGAAGQSSTTDGFASGGYTTTYSSVIDTFAFSTTGNASAWGNLTVARYASAGQQG